MNKSFIFVQVVFGLLVNRALLSVLELSTATTYFAGVELYFFEDELSC